MLEPVRPLGLYIHIPWCLSKCPYCDFNSHAVSDGIPEARYVDALLEDLDGEREAVSGRIISSIFLGGGTPSLFSAAALERLLTGIRSRCILSADTEITLEANPASVDAGHLREIRATGINRLSIGIQSLDDEALKKLGRVHTAEQACNTVAAARDAGFDNLNIDFMYGLPGQSPEQAVADVEAGIALQSTHFSHYQLTLEPGTPFFRSPPPDLADGERLHAMETPCQEKLDTAGFQHYEISAYQRDNKACAHNLNYWRYGDYLGIGAGAHGKLNTQSPWKIVRSIRHRSPQRYMDGLENGNFSTRDWQLTTDEAISEFLLNALRLRDGFDAETFQSTTGCQLSAIAPALQSAREQGLLEEHGKQICASKLGWRFLDELITRLMPEPES